MMGSVITVGIFWLCDDGGALDIIYDKEEYYFDDIANLEDEFVTYNAQHSEAWGNLSRQFHHGKYSTFAYDDFPRGRIWFDSEEMIYSIVCDKNLKNHFDDFRQAVNEIFGLDKAEYSADTMYTSRRGKYNSKIGVS